MAKDLNNVDLAGNKYFYLWVAFKELEPPTVLVHEDLWNSYVFFQNDSNREPSTDVLAFNHLMTHNCEKHIFYLLLLKF
uniref:Uncharacterized protein n=1 Tax=Panagrolaimus sp. ES5 TaxID=591445 RepID=A0AC34GF74_9BILA